MSRSRAQRGARRRRRGGEREDERAGDPVPCGTAARNSVSGGAAKPDPGRATWATTVNRQAPRRARRPCSIASIAASSPRLSPCWFTTRTWVTPARVIPRPDRRGRARRTRRPCRCPGTDAGPAGTVRRPRRARDGPGRRARLQVPPARRRADHAARPMRRRRRRARCAGAAVPGRDRVLDAVERMAGTGAVRLDDDDGVPGGREPRLEVGPCVAPMVADQLVGGPVAMRVRGTSRARARRRRRPGRPRRRRRTGSRGSGGRRGRRSRARRGAPASLGTKTAPLTRGRCTELDLAGVD